MTKQTELYDQQQKEERKKIGLIDPELQSNDDLKGFTKQQQALRQEVRKQFKINKVRTYVAKQVKFINSNQQIGESMRFLFEKDGHSAANLPLEDIIAERRKIEAQINWLEALRTELQNNLSMIKEIEDSAMDMINIDKL